MIKSAYLSHNSARSLQSFQTMLKLHLLSNKRIIIPAASISRMGVDRIIDTNPVIVKNGAILIAHGADCRNLEDYIQKYDKIHWNNVTIDVFHQFDQMNLKVVYGTDETFDNFNVFMRRCASGDFSYFRPLFKNKRFNEIINDSNYFNFEKYIDLIRSQKINKIEKSSLEAHASFFYNFFGSAATGADSIVETDRIMDFNHIDVDTSIGQNNGHLVLLMISNLLEFTDGISDFDFLSEMSSEAINKLTFSDILEIREGWLHQEIVDRYDTLLQSCNSLLGVGEDNDLVEMNSIIEKVAECRKKMQEMVRVELKREVSMYKIFRILQFGATIPLQFASSFSGLNLVGGIGKSLKDATVEIAVLANKEKHVRKLIESKTNRVRSFIRSVSIRYGKKSISAEFLREIHSRLINYGKNGLSNGNA